METRDSAVMFGLRWLPVVSVLAFGGCSAAVLSSGGETPAAAARGIFSDPATIERLGRAIHEKSRLARRATRILIEERIDPKGMGIRGWIVVPVETGWLVRFIREDEGAFSPVYDVHFPEDAKPSVQFAKNKSLKETEKAMFRARKLVLEAVEHSCPANYYNTVVLPHPEGSGWVAYALAASTRPGKIVVGGHYRIVTGPEGRKTISARPLFHCCYEFDQIMPGLPEGAGIAAYSLKHSMDSHPVETQVYLQLSCGKPWFIRTPEGIWKIFEGRLSLQKTF